MPLGTAVTASGRNPSSINSSRVASDGVTVGVTEGARIGVVGRNGGGKTNVNVNVNVKTSASASASGSGSGSGAYYGGGYGNSYGSSYGYAQPYAAGPDAAVELADFVADQYDIYGTGVNLTARVATLAGPGELVVTADLRDRLTAGLDASIEDLGWELFHLMLDVASGRKKTWAEQWKLHNALVLFNPAPVT